MARAVERHSTPSHPKHHRLAWPVLLLGMAGCASALDNQPSRVDAAAEEEAKPGDGKLTFPNPDLTAKHEAAVASPQSFAAVSDYAKAVADFCLGTLVESPGGKHRPMSELDPKHWVFTQHALTMLNELQSVQGLPPAQFELYVAVKGQLLGLAGHAEEERTLIDGYVKAHPDAVPIVKRRLEILRDAGDGKEAEAQCLRSRARMRSAPDAARLELLLTCVALHPNNQAGVTDQLEYATYLPGTSKAEQRIYRRYLVRRCIERLGSKEQRCAPACACKDQPTANREAKAKCKEACRACRIDAAQRVRDCKKTGTATPTSAPRPKPADAAAPAGPEPHKTEL